MDYDLTRECFEAFLDFHLTGCVRRISDESVGLLGEVIGFTQVGGAHPFVVTLLMAGVAPDEVSRFIEAVVGDRDELARLGANVAMRPFGKEYRRG